MMEIYDIRAEALRLAVSVADEADHGTIWAWATFFESYMEHGADWVWDNMLDPDAPEHTAKIFLLNTKQTVEEAIANALTGEGPEF